MRSGTKISSPAGGIKGGDERGRRRKRRGEKKRKEGLATEIKERDGRGRKDRKKVSKIRSGYSCPKISSVCGRLSLKLLSALLRFSINSLAFVDISANSSSKT